MYQSQRSDGGCMPRPYMFKQSSAYCQALLEVSTVVHREKLILYKGVKG